MPPLDPALVSTPSATIRSCPWSDSFDATTPDPSFPSFPSVYHLFARSATAHAHRPALGWRSGSAYQYWTYSEALSKIHLLRTALSQVGLTKGDRVGFYAVNCPQWALLHYTTLSAGGVVVPIYDSLGANIVEYVCNHAACKVVFVSKANFSKLQSLREEGKLPSVEKVVIIGPSDIEGDAEANAMVCEGVTTVKDFIDSAASVDKADVAELCLDDPLVIMYTSGTTGTPKGVMLNHRAFVASVASMHTFFDRWGQGFTENDVYLSYLPLSHILEQQVQAVIVGAGGRVGFFSGDVKLLMSDMETLRPTVFAGVPRIFSRFEQKIAQGVEGASLIQNMLFNWAYSRQLEAVQDPCEVARSGFWDALVFNRIRSKILPDARLVITGSAPMSGQTNDYLKICLQCPVVQGYGLTETSGGVICSVPEKSKSGTCGGPTPGVQVKLRDLPEMGYLTSDKPYPRGEVCIKGDMVFTGYYNNEKATQEAFDEEGFFRTGDVGQWVEDGALQIIDRAKNLFKLSQGEYVSPETLEQEYAKVKLVGQIFVYGNSLQAALLAVVVPDVLAASAWGETRGLQNLKSVAAAPGFRQDLLDQLEEKRVKAGFQGYERIQDAIIEVDGLNELGQGFTVDNNLMTPSFKLRRHQLREKYGAALDGLYGKQQGGYGGQEHT